jgi:hypothetical protein
MTNNEINPLAEFGWKVFPLYGVRDDGFCDCGSASIDHGVGKHPKTANGHKDATTNPEQVSLWLQTSTNFGISCEASDLLVLDIDPRNGGLESWERLLRAAPELDRHTVAVWTGEYSHNGLLVRGFHVYFHLPRETEATVQLPGEFEGIDIKRKGYVVAPGSKHQSGVNYEWVANCSPEEVEVVPFPEKYLDEKESGSNVGIETQSTISIGGFPETSSRGREILEKESQIIANASEGTRNETLFARSVRIGALVAKGEVNAQEAYETLIRAGHQSGLSLAETQKTIVREAGNGGLQLGFESARSKIDHDPTFNKPQNEEVIQLLNLVDWEKAFTAPEEIEWLVPGFVAAGRGHGLYSAPGLGKSLFTLDMAANLSAGLPTLGFPAKDPIKVLYLDQENGVESDVVPRLRAMGFEYPDLDNFFYASFPELMKLDSKKGGEQLAFTLDNLKPGLVVFDTVARFVDGKENDNSTWNDFYNNAGIPLKSRGIAYVRLDHVGKDETNGPRGGSAKMGDVDLVWKMSPTKGENNSFLLTNEKSRIQVGSKSLRVSRQSEPRLKHHLDAIEGTEFDWRPLLAQFEKFQTAVEIIKIAESKHGKLPGQKAVWQSEKASFQAHGIRQATVFEAQRLVASGDPMIAP